MVDRYAGMGGDLMSPSGDAAAVVPSDTVDFPNAPRRLWIGGAGNVTINTLAGNSVTYTGVPAGAYLNDPRLARVRDRHHRDQHRRRVLNP